MSKAVVKICGIKDIEIEKYAIECGASYLGFIFYQNSRRNISIENCDEILNDIEGRVNTVAVTVNPNSNDLKLYSKMKFTHLQLHGKESLDTVKEIRETSNLLIFLQSLTWSKLIVISLTLIIYYWIQNIKQICQEGQVKHLIGK